MIFESSLKTCLVFLEARSLRKKAILKSKRTTKNKVSTGVSSICFPASETEPFITDSEFLKQLQVNLSRLIAYCESAEVTLQREVAEKLANEAVKSARQVQIVQYGGLKLLVPLTKSSDQEVQRLAAHALANLSVNCECHIGFDFMIFFHSF